jgi:membrane associated rhomboid family serine protease
VKVLKALVILIVGVSGAVSAASGYMLQASPTAALGWDIVPFSNIMERLTIGAGALVLIPIGALLVYKRQ